MPPQVLVVLDEAYNEYLPTDDRYDSLGWLKNYPNLMITRTFSKVYGLAGLRVGYGLAAPGVIDLMNRVRQPFNVNSLSLAAAAAALDDDEFLSAQLRAQPRGMAQIGAGTGRAWVETCRRTAISCLARVGDAARINAELLKRGVIVRPIANYGMPELLRVSIGLAGRKRAFPRRVERLAVIINKLALIGVGLIGGSFALALKKARMREVVGVGRNRRDCTLARELGLIDGMADWTQAARPTASCWRCRWADAERCLRASRRHLKPDAVVTDAGSTKQT